jgi:hypothetical protein
MATLDLHNYSNPDFEINKANLTLSDQALAACRPVRAGANSWRAFCPFHGSDHQRSLRLNGDSGHFNCFACGAWGYTEQARDRYKEQQPRRNGPGTRTYPHSVKPPVAGNGLGRPAPSEPPAPLRLISYVPPVALKRQAPPDLAGLLERYQADLPGSLGEEYLRRRKIPLDLALRYGVGYARPGQWTHAARDWKFGRLVIPHTRPDGQLVNLYGRAVGSDDKVPKALRHDHLPGERGYFNAATLGEFGGLEPQSGLNVNNYLQNVRPDGQKPEEQLSPEGVFVCEGPFDALSLLAGGQRQVVAIFGVNGWRWEWTRRVNGLVFALDSDETGQKSWRELARQARLRGKQVGFLPVEAYGGCKDVNEAWLSGALENYFAGLGAIRKAPGMAAIGLQVSPVGEVSKPISVLEDPRPDLTGDSWLWEELFRLCLEGGADAIVEKELYGSLHGLRCCGARLQLAEDNKLKLGPGNELAVCQFVELEQYYFQARRRNLENLLNRLAARFKPAGGLV